MRLCLSNKLPGDADVAGPQTTLSSSVLSLSMPTHSLSFSEGPNFISEIIQNITVLLASLNPGPHQLLTPRSGPTLQMLCGKEL